MQCTPKRLSRRPPLPLPPLCPGATLGDQLAQPHAAPYLIAYSLLFLGARTATWWGVRQLGSARQAAVAARHAAAPGSGSWEKLGGDAGRGGGAGGSGDGGEGEAALPAELLPLLRGAWLLKLPSGAGSGAGGAPPAGSGLTHGASSGSLSFRLSGSCDGSGGCAACAAPASTQGCCAPPARQRYFQASLRLKGVALLQPAALCVRRINHSVNQSVNQSVDTRTQPVAPVRYLAPLTHE